MSAEIPTVVIVGGGVSGTLLTIQLLRTARCPLSIKVLEPREQLGRGIAYSTLSSAHLLNVPASNMSALPDEPDHFLAWLREAQKAEVPGYTFIPRLLYAQYISALLREAQRESASGISLEHIRDRALRFIRTENGFDVLMAEHRRLSANLVVLALGNGLAANPLAEKSEVQVVSAWSADAVARLPSDGSVVLVGSGLTAIDLCLSLAEDGHAGSIYMVSRHALLPRAHLEAPVPPNPRASTANLPTTVRALFHELRESARRDTVEGGSWHRIVDSIRPHINVIWRSFSIDEKRRFMRHVRSYWEVFRHRMPPEVSRRIEAMRVNGQLQVIRGRLANASTNTSGEISVRILGGHPLRETTVRAARIINCTGPQNDPRKSSDPLVQNIVAEGMARPDPVFLGFETRPNGALIRADGSAWENILALGPTRKGTLWETIAVPEIRSQAGELAREVLNRFQNHVRSA